MFSPICLSVCLFACEQELSKGDGRILAKLGGQVRCVARKNGFDFGPDPNTRIINFFPSDSSPLRGQKLYTA